MIDAYASQTHYVDHIAPVWAALDPDSRGTFVVTDEILDYARRRIPGGVLRAGYGASAHPGSAATIVAGAIDLHYCYRAVLLEHGAGQTYRGVDHASWAGGTGRDRVRLFVVPNRETGEKNLARYPAADYVVAAPRIEQLRSLAASVVRADEGWIDLGIGDTPPRSPRYVAAVRWSPTIVDADRRLVPELQSAWTEWAEGIRALGDVVLHPHPRVRAAVRAVARAWDVPYVDSWDDVVSSCPDATLLVDNSSVAYEWAALDRPVVGLVSRDWRTDVHHGLRFWDRPPGVDVWIRNEDTVPIAERAEMRAHWIRQADQLARHPDWVDARRKVAADVFPIIDGSAAIAARAIEALQ